MPYPTDKSQFRKLTQLGGELRSLHLLESPALEHWLPANRRQHNHQTGYQVIGAPEVAWNLHIGGYQPAQK